MVLTTQAVCEYGKGEEAQPVGFKPFSVHVQL